MKETYFKQKSRGSNTLWISLCPLSPFSHSWEGEKIQDLKKTKKQKTPKNQAALLHHHHPHCPIFCLLFYSGIKTSPFYLEFLYPQIPLAYNYSHRELLEGCLQDLSVLIQGNSWLKLTLFSALKETSSVN